ncbi:cytochrome P450 [Durotheca rogersii]|uniref:cytochrome P450 n=1 Tax=Durotheca rogersii TaxID=419775 RepID=UPI00221EBD50|nr:cytochrome P450 [Durotheca rogersii]KAI5858231.1 cytochrome P450 [Durotheca rogersii]
MSSTIASLGLVNVCVASSAVLVLWYIVSATAAWYRLRHIPGPFWASFSYVWMVRSILTGSVGSDFRRLNSYGKFARVGPNSIVTNDPKILRRISAARTKYVKDEWYSAIKVAPDHQTMAVSLDNETHDALKAKTAAGYSGRDNPDMEVAIDSQIAHWVDVIRQKHLTTRAKLRSVDFASLSRKFTLDVITRLSYGRPFGFLDADGDLYGYMRQMDGSMKTMVLAQEIPFFRRIVFSPFVFGLIGPKATDKGGVGKMMAITRDIIDEKFIDKTPRDDMMGSFIRRGMTRKECADEAMLQIIAGSDTTATVIRCTMLYIMATPRVYTRLKALVKDCVKRNEASTPITFEQAQKLPYLQAVIYEGLRIKNPITYGHYKRAPPEGDTIDGVFIPGGTVIGDNSVGLTYNAEVFGEDVDVFRPERFLECSDEKRVEMERAVDIVFGGGRWMCAGKTVAFLELNKVFFELLRLFDFQLVYPNKAWDEEIHFTLFHKNMWVRITEADAAEY